jgi:hypothetical protein
VLHIQKRTFVDIVVVMAKQRLSEKTKMLTRNKNFIWLCKHGYMTDRIGQKYLTQVKTHLSHHGMQ